MNQEIKHGDIDRLRRLGNPKKSIKATAWTITVKYVRYNTKNIVHGNKEVLKETWISVMDQDVKESKGTAWICKYMVTKRLDKVLW